MRMGFCMFVTFLCTTLFMWLHIVHVAVGGGYFLLFWLCLDDSGMRIGAQPMYDTRPRVLDSQIMNTEYHSARLLHGMGGS